MCPDRSDRGDLATGTGRCALAGEAGRHRPAGQVQAGTPDYGRRHAPPGDRPADPQPTASTPARRTATDVRATDIRPIGTAAAADLIARSRPRIRTALAWSAGAGGLVAYNWWVLVPFKPGLMRSPNELFSNLEVSGQPFALAMQRADLISAVLVLVAFLAIGGTSIPGARREWLAMLAFAIGGAIGAISPESCADMINAGCRHLEASFALPAQQYVHIAAGILEFGGITAAVVFAYRRTHGGTAVSARVYRAMALGALVGYPLLGAAYLLDRLGGIMEGAFFTAFTIIVATQLIERGRTRGSAAERPLRSAARIHSLSPLAAGRRSGSRRRSGCGRCPDAGRLAVPAPVEHVAAGTDQDTSGSCRCVRSTCSRSRCPR